MKPDPKLLQSLEQLDVTREQFRRLPIKQPANWKTDYARLRPVLQEQTTKAIGLTEIWLRQKGDAALLTQYRKLLDHATAQLSSHQARWPVLVLDVNDPSYIASMKEVIAKFDLVLDLVKQSMRT